MKIVILVLFLVLVFAAFSWGMWIIINSADKIHRKLDALKVKAEEAKTHDELKAAYAELIEVNKECWHKSFSSKVMVIDAILKTKYGFLKENK